MRIAHTLNGDVTESTKCKVFSWNAVKAKKENTMSRKAKMLIGAVTLVLLLCGVMPANATTIITNIYTNDFERLQYIYDSTNIPVPANNAYVGQYDTAIDYNERSVFIFELPTLDPGQMIVSATFRSFLSAVDGAVYPVDLYHVQDLNHGNPLVGTDYSAGTANLVQASFVTPTSPTVQYYSANVLTNVLADYANDPSYARYAVFRLQLNNEAKSDSGNKRYYFTSGIVVGRTTELLLETAPDPSSAIIILGQ